MQEGDAVPAPSRRQPVDPGGLRISDHDRHQVAEVLRRAAGEGRIDFAELDERLEAAYAAKTYAQLVPLTADLPEQVPGPPLRGPALAHRTSAPSTFPLPSPNSSFALMSETKRIGVWEVGGQHSALAMMGSVTLDLREVRFGADEVVINAFALMGEVKVVVNPATVVVVDGLAVMGEFSEQRSKAPAEPTAGSPVVRVKGLAVMGSVQVQRKAMPGQTPGRLGWSGR
jgi:hypothetical protein